MPLSAIPGFYEGYVGARKRNEQTELNDVRQASTLMQIIGQQQERQAKQAALMEDQATKAALAESGGDATKAMQILLTRGAHGPAAKLAPILESQRKAGETKRPHVVGRNLVSSDGTVLYSGPEDAPKAPAPPEIIKLNTMMESLPEGHPFRAQLGARIKLLTERQPPMQINMPSSSDTMQGEDGKTYKVRIGRDGKVEAIPLVTPSGTALRPPETAAERKATADATAGEATLDGVRERVKSMSGKIQGNSFIVGPAGAVRRGVETAAGVVQPGVDTPALDYNNEMKLLLADVRKVVEKDPNLSNQERQNLYETLGGGTFQTPGSAIRALNGVLGYMENKRVTGAKPRKATGPAVGAVDQGYRFKGGDPGKSENWEKVQ